MRNPAFFLVGCPRSGTTLLRRMVDAHPLVAVIPEMGWLAERWETRDGLAHDGTVTPELVADLLRRGSIGRYTKLPLSPADLTLCQGGSYARLVEALFDGYGTQAGKRIVGNKTVDLVRSVATLHELWPEARIVHLIRDGRDVATSAVNWRRAPKLAARYATWDQQPAATAALWWEWHVRRGREAGSMLDRSLYREVRYEDLVAHTEQELAALCAFLDIPPDAAMVSFHEGRERDSDDPKHGWKPATPGLRDWRREMPFDVLEVVEAVCGALLDELGYQRGVVTPSRVASATADRIRGSFETNLHGDP